MSTVYYKFLSFKDAELFTVVCMPKEKGKFPTVIMRTPYVDDTVNQPFEEICAAKQKEFEFWLKNNYVVVFQHCRGRGKSSGYCIPYINERDDGLFLQEWVRNQPFYNGEIYLCGGSYTSSVHFVTAPFAPDIKGAVLEIQDCERYNCNYRNGFYKSGLHGSWYVDMYKKKNISKKNYTDASYNILPLSDFSKTVFGECSEDFDEILKHPDKNDPFWRTHLGGGEAHEAIKYADIPILLVTGWYDIFTGGIFDMWYGLDPKTRSQCALAVHPFNHSGFGDLEPICFSDGCLKTEYENYPVHWINAVRGIEAPPFKQGEITYYKTFANKWCCDSFNDADEKKIFQLGEGEVTFRYNPYAPAFFKGGLSTNFGGNEWQDQPNSRYDIISLFTPEFDEYTFIKGKISAKLKVKSTCEDTCFYVRISLCKEDGYYGIRDDINQISNFTASYTPNDEIEMDFSFDEHAFVIKKGEKLRIDISSSAFPWFVRHTNNKGLFSEQTTARVADNTVILKDSFIELPIKTER